MSSTTSRRHAPPTRSVSGPRRTKRCRTCDGADAAADDFTRLATAAFLLGRTNTCVQALQRSYRRHLDEAEPLGAARVCFWLALVLFNNGEPAVGGGWVARGRRLLDDVSEEVVERGYLQMLLMFQHIFADELDAAAPLTVEVTEYGRRFRDPDLLANGLNAQGRMALYSGEVPRGLALLDEAMVGVSTGEVSPVFAGEIYCSMIEACQEVSDYGRAAEWTQALTAWIEEQPDLVAFTGQCAVHRGQIMRVRGAWDRALEELDRAVRRYVEAGTPAPAGIARAEAGDVHRLRGDLDAAESAYESAIGFGFEPQPGLALLWLARGRRSAAQHAVHRLLDEPRDPVHRSQLLPGAIEALLGLGEFSRADVACRELVDLAADFGCPPLRAMAGGATAACRLDGAEIADAAGALSDVRQSLALWRVAGGAVRGGPVPGAPRARAPGAR